MEKDNKGRKTNVAQYEERMTEVFEMILYKKLSYTEFRTQAAERFNITTRQAENLYKEARERLKERFAQEQEEVLQEQLNRLFDLLDRCRASGNRRIEAEVLRDLTKLYGLEQTKIDITSGGEPININIILDK
jgi:predicted phage gp36 major capsid-like protein